MRRRYTNWGAEPDWPTVHRELKRKHVTLLIVWDEYIAKNPFPVLRTLRAFESRLPVTMRQTHAAGAMLFVDYAGDDAPVVVDRLTGEIGANLRRGTRRAIGRDMVVEAEIIE